MLIRCDSSTQLLENPFDKVPGRCAGPGDDFVWRIVQGIGALIAWQRPHSPGIPVVIDKEMSAVVSSLYDIAFIVASDYPRKQNATLAHIQNIGDV